MVSRSTTLTTLRLRIGIPIADTDKHDDRMSRSPGRNPSRDKQIRYLRVCATSHVGHHSHLVQSYVPVCDALQKNQARNWASYE